MVPETYIGDGVYASFDGYAITLRAPRDGGDHFIVLEPTMLDELNTFSRREWEKMDE